MSGELSNLPVVIEGESARSRGKSYRRERDEAFSAQVLGQSGHKRGLKGGKPVLDTARSAYLEAEWSGPDDRRLSAGRLMKVTL
jgi:hypothetical protein